MKALHFKAALNNTLLTPRLLRHRQAVWQVAALRLCSVKQPILSQLATDRAAGVPAAMTSLQLRPATPKPGLVPEGPALQAATQTPTVHMFLSWTLVAVAPY